MRRSHARADAGRPAESRWLAVARLLTALVLLALSLPVAPARAVERGLAVWSPSFITNDTLTGGDPIEPGASYEFDVSVRASLDIADATVTVGRTEVGVEIFPEVFDLIAHEPTVLRVRLTYPAEFPRRLKRFYLARLRLNGPAGPLGGAFMVRTHITDPQVGYTFDEPPPVQLTAGDIWSSQLQITTTRPLTSMIVVRDRTYVTIGKFGTLTRADQSTVPITLTQPVALLPREVASVPITIAAPLKPRSTLHAATVRVLNRGQPLRQRQPLRFKVSPVSVDWQSSTIGLTMEPGEIREIETEVTLSGRVPDATISVRASNIATVIFPEGPVDLEADVPQSVVLLVQAPFDPGSFVATVVIGRRGETLNPPLRVLVRVQR